MPDNSLIRSLLATHTRTHRSRGVAWRILRGCGRGDGARADALLSQALCADSGAALRLDILGTPAFRHHQLGIKHF